MLEHKVTDVVTETMLPYPDTYCIVAENVSKDGAEYDFKLGRISSEKSNIWMSKRRKSLPVLPSYFMIAPHKETRSGSLPATCRVENLSRRNAMEDKRQQRISLDGSDTELKERVHSLSVFLSHLIIGFPKEKGLDSLPAFCLVKNLRMNGAEEDRKQQQVSLERIKIQMSKRKKSIPLLPSYLIIISPNKKKVLGKKSKKDVSFQLPVGVLMEQVVTGGEVEELKYLLSKHGNKLVEVRDHNGVPLILRAILEDQMECLKVLLAAGANIMAGDAEGLNVFHVASTMDNIAATKIILEAGGLHKGLTQFRNKDGERAIDLAESLGMSRLLLYADLTEFRLHCNTVTEHNSYMEKSEEKVLQHVKECFETHSTFLALDELLEENTCYSSLLHLAATMNYSRLADYVCTHSFPSLEFRDRKGWTPLHTSAYNNNVDMALFLVDRGANIHAITHSYLKPSDLTQHKLILTLMEEQQVCTA